MYAVRLLHTVLRVLIAEPCLRLYQKQCERPLGALRRLKNSYSTKDSPCGRTSAGSNAHDFHNLLKCAGNAQLLKTLRQVAVLAVSMGSVHVLVMPSDLTA